MSNRRLSVGSGLAIVLMCYSFVKSKVPVFSGDVYIWMLSLFVAYLLLLP